MKKLNSKIFRLIISASQIAIWPLVATIGLIRSRSIIILLDKKDISRKKNYILVANHGRKSDPFIILRHLPLRVFFRLLPFRFMTFNKFIDAWFGKILIILGSYPSKPHPKYIYGIEASLEYIKNHEPIVIFPEGKRHNGIDRPEPKKGVSILANEDTMLIPVFIDWHYIKKKPKYNMVIGKPYVGKNMEPVEIMNRVYSLSRNLK